MKPFPTLPKTTEFLRLLIGKAPALKPGKPAASAPALPGFAGLYMEDGATEACAAIILDFNAAIGLSGAFMGTPQGMIMETLKTKKCHEMVPPTLYEILNVSGSLLNSTGEVHIRLAEMVEFTGKPTGAVADVISKATQKLDLETTVAPCPAGYLSIARV